MSSHRVSIVFIGAALAACSQDDGVPDGAAACVVGDGVTIWIESVVPGLNPGPLDVAAAATVLPTSDSLGLRFDDGSVEWFRYDVPGDEAQVFVEGERVWAELTADGPFWVNQQIELYALDASGGPGELRLAAWWGEYALEPVRGWTLDIEDGDCDASNTCGPAIGQNVRVTAPGGAQAVVAPGTSVEVEGHQVSNGHTSRYLASIECTDTPGTWSGVSVVRL